MANCRICGLPAGILKKEHAACRVKQEKSKNDIRALVLHSFHHAEDIQFLRRRAEHFANEGMLQSGDAVKAVVEGISHAIDTALADNSLSNEEESRIVKINNAFEDVLDPTDLGESREKLVKAATIRDLRAGIRKSRLQIQGLLPFLVQGNEEVIWLFKNVKYYETKMRSQYVGGSQGISIRIVKGVYYRAGAFKGERTQSPETKHADTGHFMISSKNVHFKGDRKALRIPLTKIVGLEMHQDGITLFKDGVNPMPQCFLLDDPWFAANVINSIG